MHYIFPWLSHSLFSSLVIFVEEWTFFASSPNNIGDCWSISQLYLLRDLKLHKTVETSWPIEPSHLGFWKGIRWLQINQFHRHENWIGWTTSYRIILRFSDPTTATIVLYQLITTHLFKKSTLVLNKNQCHANRKYLTIEHTHSPYVTN